MSSQHDDSAGRPAIDVQPLIDELGDDPEMLREIFGLVVKTTAECLAVIRTANAAADARALSHAAHTLKGSLLSVAAIPAGQAAAAVEAAAGAGDITTARTAVATLEAELERLRPALDALLTDPS